MRETSDISAIIVNHVILLHPTDLCLPRGVQWLASGGRSLGIEVSVWGCEWGLAPIRFHKPTPCGPILSVPKARVYSHGLVLWERNPFCLQILELPYWCPIHRESVTIKKWLIMNKDVNELVYVLNLMIMQFKIVL